MIKSISLVVKIQLNVHDLNNEAVAGNVTDIRMMEFLKEDGIRCEAPCVSGRMLKHWHYEAVRQLIAQGQYSGLSLCAGCRAGEPLRPSEVRDGRITQIASAEREVISNCVVCDVHGYLIAQEAEGDQRGISARRTSRVMFSWLMPVLGEEAISKQVIHNRVSSDPDVMRPFNKSYASGIYSFVSSLDAERIGLIELELGGDSPYAVSDANGRRDRIKVVIEAYRHLISGKMGASLSHAVPHSSPVEVLVAYSENSPLPFPVSGIYQDYIEKTRGLMPQGTILLYWGEKDILGVTKKDTISEIFDELLKKVDQ
jgi:CRISPR-associated protein Cst2